MTNICQAIEEELRAIQFAEDSGQNIYETQTSGMSLALWKEMLSHPETMRIEASEDFVKTAVELTTSLLEDLKTEKSEASFNFSSNEDPVILYIPDFDHVKEQADEESYGDGVFVLHWLEKAFEITGKIGYSWVRIRTTRNRDLLWTPRSLDDISEKAFVQNYLQGNSPSSNGMTEYTNASPTEDLKILQAHYLDLHYTLASVIYMTRQPNFVTQTTVGNSGVRKRLEKKKGIPRERWSRIQWNVGQNVQREVRETMGEEHCTALHRVRGFYRKAKSHYNNVTKIEGKWFQWIEPFWRGHPAFGIIKSTYAPKQMDKLFED